jgi:hypothetical protein
MSKPANTYKKALKKRKERNGSAKVGGTFKNVLGGTFLSNERSIRLLPFFLFLTLLVMIYIGNTYYAEKTEREIQALRSSLKELRYEFITTRSEMMHRSQQSEIARRLQNTGIKESKVPPVKVIKSNQ